MNAARETFDLPENSHGYRTAGIAVALLGLGAILAATLQLIDLAISSAPVPRVTVVGYASSLHLAEDAVVASGEKSGPD